MITLKVCKEIYAKILKDGYVTKKYLYSKLDIVQLAKVLIFFENNDMELYDETVIIPNPNFKHKGSTLETVKEVRYYSLNVIRDKWKEEGHRLPKNGRIRTGERSMFK